MDGTRTIAEVRCGVIVELNARSAWPKCNSKGVGTKIMKHSEVSSARCATGFSRSKPNT